MATGASTGGTWWPLAALLLLAYFLFRPSKRLVKVVVPLSVRPASLEGSDGTNFADPNLPEGTTATSTATGFQSFNGYGQGDYSDAALADLSRQSQYHLALTSYEDPRVIVGRPTSLFDVWQAIRNAPGDAKEAARAAIATAFSGYNATVDSMSNPVPSSFGGWS